MNTKQHRAGWMEIAKAFGTPKCERTGQREWIAKVGICNAIGEVFPEEPGYFYRIAIKNATYGCYANYVWPLPDDESRCLFACLMAAMTREEYENFVS